jgi:hypothetical protein
VLRGISARPGNLAIMLFSAQAFGHPMMFRWSQALTVGSGVLSVALGMFALDAALPGQAIAGNLS